MTILFTASCCYEVNCEQDSLKFTLISFSGSEIDSLIFRRFQANSNFQTLKDSMLIGNINILNPNAHGDSVSLATYNSTYFKFQLQPGYDYEIFIPGATKLVRISDIVERPTQQKECAVSDGNHGCSNPITSYRIDGQIRSGEYFFVRR
jgi:hypothetical protein